MEKLDAHQDAETTKQIRDSNLLLVGRVVALGLNFLVQILIVRYLSKESYGVFAYALSIVGLGQALVTFGLDRGLSRFVPIFDEQRKYPEMLGTIVLVFSSILSLGLSFVLITFGLRNWLAGSIGGDAQAVTVIAILILLAPLEAIDNLLVQTLAVFGQANAIFFRRYVLAPGMRLFVVLLLVLTGSGVTFLAAGYVLGGLAGVAIYGVVLYRLLRDQPSLKSTGLRAMRLPWKTILMFTLPLMTTDLLFMAQSSVDAIMLGSFLGTEEVATLRAVAPVARMNTLVLQSFGVLFTPLAARYFARQDHAGANRLYWQTAIWVAVLTFPIFAITTGLAEPVTLLLFGEEYRDSGAVLAVLGLGYYLHASLGFNGRTLTVYGRVRYIVTTNIIIIIANIGLNLLLIPRFGAIGAASGTAATFVLHNIMKQAGLLIGTEVSGLDRGYRRIYAAIAVGVVVIAALAVIRPPLAVAIGVAALTSSIVIAISRRNLRLGDTYPSLLKFRLFRLLFEHPSEKH